MGVMIRSIFECLCEFGCKLGKDEFCEAPCGPAKLFICTVMFVFAVPFVLSDVFHASANRTMFDPDVSNGTANSISHLAGITHMTLYETTLLHIDSFNFNMTSKDNGTVFFTKDH